MLACILLKLLKEEYEYVQTESTNIFVTVKVEEFDEQAELHVKMWNQLISKKSVN